MARSRGTFMVDFANASLGVNTADLPIRLPEGQVSESRNAILLEEGGIKRRPGVKALSTEATFSTYLKGLFNYIRIDGTESLIAVENEDVHSVNTNNGALTKLYDIGGTGEAYAVSARGKLWITNGSGVHKLEGSDGYPVGIELPGSGSSSAQSGGSLSPGTYKIFVTYYRKVSGDIVLYSQGATRSDVNLTSGSQTVRVTVSAPSDTQVSGVAVFMTDAGGSVYYRYATSDGTGPKTIDISDTSERNTAILYTVVAANNARPENFDSNILYQDNRLWGAVEGTVYYSKKGFTVYDLEKFPTSNRIDLPYVQFGMFAIGEHLYFSTVGGIYMLPYSDPNGELVHTDDRWYFRYIRTVQPIEGGVIGLTNSGVRLFGGRRFSDVNFSLKITPDIEQTRNPNENFLPVGFIYNRKDRTEYILSYQDTRFSSVNNNVRAVLNIDQLARGVQSWEFWDCGANYFCKFQNNTIYAGQSHVTRSSVYTEQNNTLDEGIYHRDGTLIDAPTKTRLFIKTRTHIEGLWSIMEAKNVGAMIFARDDVTVRLVNAEDASRKDIMELTDTGNEQTIVFGGAVFGSMVFSSETSVRSVIKGVDGLNFYSFYIEIENVSDDIDFEINILTVFGDVDYSRNTSI